jgi:peroxin-7
MTVNVYDLGQKMPLVGTHGHHTEFVTGVDLSLHVEKMVASTSWDGRTMVWDYTQVQPFA